MLGTVQAEGGGHVGVVLGGPAVEAGDQVVAERGEVDGDPAPVGVGNASFTRRVTVR